MKIKTMNKIILIIASLLFITVNSAFSQAIEYKSITQEEFSEMYEIAFFSDAPNKATYLYEDFKSEITINDKKLPKPESFIYMHVIRGNGGISLNINMDYDRSIKVLIDEKDKVKKTEFHYQYNCIIEYSKSDDRNNPLLKRGYIMSRYQLIDLCTGNLKVLFSEFSNDYKIKDLAIYSIEKEIVFTIDKIKK